jgi:hypothetical protein
MLVTRKLFSLANYPRWRSPHFDFADSCAALALAFFVLELYATQRPNRSSSLMPKAHQLEAAGIHFI